MIVLIAVAAAFVAGPTLGVAAFFGIARLAFTHWTQSFVGPDEPTEDARTAAGGAR